MTGIRRRTLLAGLFGVGATTIVGGRHVAAADTTHTLWMLNPDWGTSLVTDSGSDPKTRCRGSACHLAAPHRFFLSRADALAGRLHACCLAQPVEVRVCVDLNSLMPYYRARLGGVDGRCQELPAGLRTAVYAGAACARATPAPSASTPPSALAIPPPSASTPPSALATPPPSSAALTSTLPLTGAGGVVTAAKVGVGAVAVGVVLKAISADDSGSEERSAEPS